VNKNLAIKLNPAVHIPKGMRIPDFQKIAVKAKRKRIKKV